MMVDTMNTSLSKLTRSQRIWEKAIGERDTTISLARAKLLTESWKETEGLPQPIRRAKAFDKIVNGMPIFIDGEQLLVGDPGAWPGACEWHPEHQVSWVLRELEGNRPPYGVDQAVVDELKEIADYWKGRNFRDSYLAGIGPEKAKMMDEMGEEGAFVFAIYSEIGLDKGWFSPNYEKAITKGFNGIIAEAEEELAKTKIKDDESREKCTLLKAIIIDLKAGISCSKRYAALAREMAKTAGNGRKQELETIADMCEWVPANPARTFQEALQSLWFVQVLGWYDTGMMARSPGRVDQYLYPCYKSDIESGRLTSEEAIELLGCFRVKMHFRAFESVYSHTHRGDFQFHNCTLGGQTIDGRDATNDLSFLWLEAAFRVRSPHPTLSVRWHQHINQDFLIRAAELTRLGMGFPAWFGDDSNIAYCMGPWMGATLEEARDYQLSGCVIPTIPHKTGATWPMILNMGKILELALFDGQDPTSGQQWGPRTGRFEGMEGWDDVYPAYKEQVRYFMNFTAEYLREMRMYRAQMVPQVFLSAFFDDCIQRGKDPLGGGCRYLASSMYLLPTGIIDGVDSLAAIRKVVFEEKKISKQQLMEAMAANFDGYEDVRKLLIAAPKFGNDIDEVDYIARDLYKLLVDVCAEIDGCFGEKWVCAPHSIDINSFAGRRVGALPSGRLSGYSLADGAVSACQGADTSGPTALIKSAGKIDQVPLFGTLFNMKFHPTALNTKDDVFKLLNLVRTYFHDYGGKHIQFNVVSRDTLIDAQINPENYKNLVVRVAGYSALWVELDRNIQDEIIARTENTW